MALFPGTGIATHPSVPFTDCCLFPFLPTLYPGSLSLWWFYSGVHPNSTMAALSLPILKGKGEEITMQGLKG